MLWYGYVLKPYDEPMKGYVGVAKYIDEESIGDARDVEASLVSEPFEAADKEEALLKYKEILKGAR